MVPVLFSTAHYVLYSVLLKFLFIYWGGGREREPWVCCSTYLCIRWLLLGCALTQAQTRRLGGAGGRSCLTKPGNPAGTHFILVTSHNTREVRAPLSSSSDRGGGSARRGRGTHQGRAAGRGRRERGPPEPRARSPAASPARSREAAGRAGGAAPGLPAALLGGARPLRLLPGSAGPSRWGSELDLGVQRPRSRVPPRGHTPHSRPGVPSSAGFRRRKSARSSPGNGTAHARL